MRRPNSVSSQEVARRAGVSQATVSYVLNDRRDQAISEGTRARVLEAARELKYRPNRLTNGVLRGKTSVIGLIAPWLESAFHVSILDGIREEIEKHGYHAFVAWGKHEPEAQASEVELLLEHRVEGLIYISEGTNITGHAQAWLSGVLDERVPCVVIDDRTLSARVDCVVSDDLEGAAAVVAHLAALGHRRIAYWSAYWDASPYGDRLQGYKNGLSNAGLALDPSLIAEFPPLLSRTAIALHALLQVADPPSAVFLSGDAQAMLLRQAAEDLGVRVPEDLAIVGYSDQHYAVYNDLTTVRQDSRAMGREGAKLLLARMAEPDRAPQTIQVPTRLVVRSSTVPQARGQRFDPVV